MSVLLRSSVLFSATLTLFSFYAEASVKGVIAEYKQKVLYADYQDFTNGHVEELVVEGRTGPDRIRLIPRETSRNYDSIKVNGTAEDKIYVTFTIGKKKSFYQYDFNGTTRKLLHETSADNAQIVSFNTKLATIVERDAVILIDVFSTKKMILNEVDAPFVTSDANIIIVPGPKETKFIDISTQTIVKKIKGNVINRTYGSASLDLKKLLVAECKGPGLINCSVEHYDFYSDKSTHLFDTPMYLFILFVNERMVVVSQNNASISNIKLIDLDNIEVHDLASSTTLWADVTVTPNNRVVFATVEHKANESIKSQIYVYDSKTKKSSLVHSVNERILSLVANDSAIIFVSDNDSLETANKTIGSYNFNDRSSTIIDQYKSYADVPKMLFTHNGNGLTVIKSIQTRNADLVLQSTDAFVYNLKNKTKSPINLSGRITTAILFGGTGIKLFPLKIILNATEDSILATIEQTKIESVSLPAIQ